MAQGRSTKVISMSKWIRTSRPSIKNTLSLQAQRRRTDELIKSIVPPSEAQFLRVVRPAEWSVDQDLAIERGLGREHLPSGLECYTICCTLRSMKCYTICWTLTRTSGSP
jgi:hypothetical protein